MPNPLSPIGQPTLVADQVYQALENAILTGELAAGSPLKVRDLAAMVDTSITPVREALSRLEKAGLATRIPHRGAVVRTFTVAELIEMYEVRTILEVEATRLSAPKTSKKTLRSMEASCKRMRRAVDAGRITEALTHDEETLRAFYRECGNSVLVSMIDELWLRCWPYKFIGASEALEHDDMSLWSPQPALVAALQAGDVEEAVSITTDSLASARRRLELRLEQQ